MPEAPKTVKSSSQDEQEILVPEGRGDCDSLEGQKLVPPDGGYGWVIVFCGFMFNLVLDGMCFMGGVLFVELQDHYQQPKGKTQWVTTLVSPSCLLVGPFVGALVNKFGCRVMTISGSLIAATSFVVSACSPNIEAMIFTYGIMLGVGFGCMFLPAICFVSSYFDRRRALATGIAMCGSGLGTFIFPPLMDYLIGVYGWRGCLLIMAGIILNGSVIGALMRPLKPIVVTTPKKSCSGQDIPNNMSSKHSRYSVNKNECQLSESLPNVMPNGYMDNSVQQHPCSVTVPISEPDLRQNNFERDCSKVILISDSCKSLQKFNKIHNQQVSGCTDAGRDSESGQTKMVLGIPLINSPNNATDLKLDATYRCHSQNREVHTKVQSSAPDLRQNVNSIQTITDPTKHLCLSCAHLKTGSSRHPGGIIQIYRQNMVKRHEGESPLISQILLKCVSDADEARARKRKDLARVMYRQDIFYTGSVTSIPEYKSSPNIDQYTRSVLCVPEPEEGNAKGRCASFTNVIQQMFDLKLFKSVTFIVLLSNAFFSFLGFFVPFMFIPDLANIMGSSSRKAALLVSVLGICNTFGRLATGWLADRPWADCLVMQNVALITGGIATALVPLLKSYVLLVAYCCVYGSCMAMFITLRSIVTAEMMGVQKLNNAFGLTIFFQGVAGLAGSPLAGFIFDATGSYTVSFVVAGSFMAFSGLICLPLRRIAQWENAKSQDGDGYQIVVPNDLPLPEIDVDASRKDALFGVD